MRGLALIAAATALLLISPAEAKRSFDHPAATDDWRRIDTRYDWQVSAERRSGYSKQRKAKVAHNKPRQRASRAMTVKTARPSPAIAAGDHKTEIVDHPAGCPRRSFCGCGTALHIFGHQVRDLWLAANWFRFPASDPGPGKVAVRRHHVFAILKDLGGGRVLAYDPNSGGHKTRVHVRSLSGYRVVDPGGLSKWAYAG